MIDGDGYLHIPCNLNNKSLNCCRGIEQSSLILDNKISMTGCNEDHVSYPEFYKLPEGDLRFMFRDGSSGNGNFVINRYSTSEKVWRKLQTNLIDGE